MWVPASVGAAGRRAGAELASSLREWAKLRTWTKLESVLPRDLPIGLAKDLDPNVDESTISIQGAVIGTVRAMSPEQDALADCGGFEIDRDESFQLFFDLPERALSFALAYHRKPSTRAHRRWPSSGSAACPAPTRSGCRQRSSRCWPPSSWTLAGFGSCQARRRILPSLASRPRRRRDR